MIQEGQVVLFRFPQTDLVEGKLRPALALRELPGHYGDWLICMISSRTQQAIQGFDEIISVRDPDFADTGLKIASVIRIGRLAVVDSGVLVGSLGHIAHARLATIRKRLSMWIQGA